MLFDPGSNVLYPSSGGSASGAYQIIAGRGSETSVGLDDVVTALCGRVGLTAGDLDVSELTADEVLGFGIARQISVRGALELLAATYAFEAIESDHQLKFKKRGRPPSRVITEDDLAPLSDRETFRETRAQEVDLPLRFSVRYQDADLDADEGTQTAKRIAGPDATMASHNEATLDLPITLTATQAMTVALRQLYGAWLERVMHEWQTDWTHLDLEPGDVVQIALHDGSLFAVRLLQCELGANLAVSWQTVVEESSSYTVPAVPAAALNYIPRAEPVSSEAKLFLLDMPLCRTWTTCNGWPPAPIGPAAPTSTRPGRVPCCSPATTAPCTPASTRLLRRCPGVLPSTPCRIPTRRFRPTPRARCGSRWSAARCPRSPRWRC